MYTYEKLFDDGGANSKEKLHEDVHDVVQQEDPSERLWDESFMWGGELK